jgi:hypothetical protein
MRVSLSISLFAALLLPFYARSQEATAGLSVPVTISGNAQYSRTSESGSSSDNYRDFAFRALIAPSLQLGPHWFAYSAVDVRSSSYGGYEASGPGSAVTATLMQGYLGYKTDWKDAALLFKGGRLASAFGLYPLDYDDAKTPLIDIPLGYTMNLPLRPDQLPCSLYEIYWQSADDPLRFHCGGAQGARYGMLPVTLYGIPAVEAQLSWNRIDARLQLTNSSPANPQSLLSNSEHLQWTAGGGYSFRGGLHAGVSGFRGAYLDEVVAPDLPADRRPQDFAASGIGIDLVWLHGPWSMQGEWQRFEFALPGFSKPPSIQAGYAQIKRVLSPRVFVAVRSAIETPGFAAGPPTEMAVRIGYGEANQEIDFGYRINRFELLKLGANYDNRPSWALGNGLWNAEHGFGIEFQLVTSFTPISKAFH